MESQNDLNKIKWKPPGLTYTWILANFKLNKKTREITTAFLLASCRGIFTIHSRISKPFVMQWSKFKGFFHHIYVVHRSGGYALVWKKHVFVVSVVHDFQQNSSVKIWFSCYLSSRSYVVNVTENSRLDQDSSFTLWRTSDFISQVKHWTKPELYF